MTRLPADHPLSRVVLPHLGADQGTDVSLKRLRGSRPVFRFSLDGNGVGLVGKFFADQVPTTPQDRSLAQEYQNYLAAQDLGLTAAGLIPRLVGRSPGVRLGLLLEGISGPDLDYYLSEAAEDRGPETCLHKLANLAELLAFFHSRPLIPEPVSPAPVFAYFQKIQGQLKNLGLLSPEDAEFLADAGREWPRVWAAFPDRQVLLHGDATPTNFLFPNGRAVAVDLERLRVGDRLFDLSWVAGELRHAWGWRGRDFAASETAIQTFFRSYLKALPADADPHPAPFRPQPLVHGPGGAAHRPEFLPFLGVPPGPGGRGPTLSRALSEAFMKTVLILAGSDPGAGAGLQQDLKTATLLGVYGLTVVTALTVQNSLGVQAVHPVAADVAAAQLDAVLDDFPVNAVKIGMVGTGAIVRIIARRLRDLPEIPPVVLDPVLAAGRGGALLDEEGLALLKSELFPLATILTPNVPEAERLSGLAIDTPAHLEDAARKLQALGPAWVLAKGGHLAGEPVDVLTDGKNAYHLPGTRLAAPHNHGSGCLLATALAAHLAQGLTVPEAVNQARELVRSALRHGLPLGQGVGPVNPYAPFAREMAKYNVLEELQAAAARLVREDISPLIPEVMSNLGYALPYAEGPEHVAAFPGRILKTPQGTLVPASPPLGPPATSPRSSLPPKKPSPSFGPP
jgi:hydroxymethylpyrimidine kinase/phosphomethylpyrimidine kinase